MLNHPLISKTFIFLKYMTQSHKLCVSRWRLFSFSKHPDQLCDLPSPLTKMLQALCPQAQSGQGIKLTTHSNLLLKVSKKCGYTSTPLYAFMPSSSSSCSGRIRFDSCSLYPQNEIGPSISSSVVLCVFVLLVYIVVLV